MGSCRRSKVISYIYIVHTHVVYIVPSLFYTCCSVQYAVHVHVHGLDVQQNALQNLTSLIATCSLLYKFFPVEGEREGKGRGIGRSV